MQAGCHAEQAASPRRGSINALNMEQANGQDDLLEWYLCKKVLKGLFQCACLYTWVFSIHERPQQHKYIWRRVIPAVS